MTRFFPWLILTPILLFVTFQLHAAGFGINATRVIYPENSGSISVTVRNTDPQIPYLVQAIVSNNQDTQTPAPFVITPPLFRLEPQTTNQLRIAFTGAKLPSDRESIFYLHATAIPSSTELDPSRGGSDISASVRFGIGNIIKLFYRPQNLQESSAAAQRKLQFFAINGGLKVSNPSPYYISLAGLSICDQKLELKESAAMMLVPFGSYTWNVKKVLPVGCKVEWKTINDLGGIDAFSTILP